MPRIQVVPGKTGSRAFRLTSSAHKSSRSLTNTEKINRREDTGDQKAQFPIQLLFTNQACHEPDKADYECR